MKKFLKLVFNILIVFIVCISCNMTTSNDEVSNIKNEKEEQIDYSDWDKVLNKSKGSTVNFYGWGGSELVNSWIDTKLTPYVKQHYDINLNRVPMNIDEILSLLNSEKTNKVENGAVDLIWINGENFASAKENGLLFGPFTDYLPNFNKYIDKNDDEIKYDFATSIDGYESPYSKAQLVMIYDSEKITNPPVSADALLDYVKQNKYRFTYEALPGFTGSAFVRNLLYEKVGYEKLSKLDKNITKNELKSIIEPGLEYMRELNKYLWQEGKTFPNTNEIVDSMFMDGTIDFSMSYDPYHVSSMIENGQYKNTVKSFVFDNGTIGNTNYVAIGFNSSNKEGAMCVADAILSVDMQSSKMSPKIWGTIPVLDNDKLTNEEKNIFDNVDIGIGSLSQEILLEKRKPELPAYLVTMIEEIWSEEVVAK